MNEKPFDHVLGENVANWMHLHPVSGLETETEEGLQPGRANDHSMWSMSSFMFSVVVFVSRACSG